MLAGKDKGKTGKIVRALPREDKVLVEGVNMKKVHSRGKKSGEKGAVIDKGFPIHVSNVKLVDKVKTKAAKK